MANITTYLRQLKRGGFPAVGPKVGVIDVDPIDISAAGATDTVELVEAEAAMLVLACGVEVVTATTGATEVEIGDGTDADQFFTATAVNATGELVGTPTNQMLLAGEKLVLTLSVAAPGGTGVLRPWAVVADVNDLSGD